MYSETKVEVRYAETDKMGIVHHSVYPIWYELARTKFIKELGISYSQMEEMGVMTPLVQLSCKYIHPADYEDILTIRVSVSKLTPARVVFDYEVYKEGIEKPINTGSTTHAWVEKNLHPINFKKEFPELYKKIESTIEE